MLAKFADWSSIPALIVGIVGLVYSILAYREAGKSKKASLAAREAARDAKRDVRTLVAAERLGLLIRRASELSIHIEQDNLQVAKFLARELLFEINSAIARWEFLEDDTKARFKKASRLVKQVTDFLRNGEFQEPARKAKVLGKCETVSFILSGESGKIQSELEGGGAS